MTERIRLIFDFNHLAWRVLHSNEGLQSSKGEKTGMVFGVLRTLKALCDKHKPVEVIFCADRGTSFRKVLMETYKAHRAPVTESQILERESFCEQFARTEAVLETLGIPVVGQEGLEADDLCAILSKSVPFDGITIVVSGDKDLLQLVDKNTKYYNPNPHYDKVVSQDGWQVNPEDPPTDNARSLAKAREITPETFTWRSEKIGKCIPFDKWLMYRALVGDSSDELPGIVGIGEVTAAKIVAQADSVEDIIEKKDAMIGLNARQRAALNSTDLHLQYNMINLIAIAESDPGQQIAACMKSFITRREADLATFRTLLIRYEITSILTEFSVWTNNIPLAVSSQT